MTQYGLRRWFSNFDIHDCFVARATSPSWMFAWLSNHILFHVEQCRGPEVRAMVGAMKLSQWARFGVNRGPESDSSRWSSTSFPWRLVRTSPRGSNFAAVQGTENGIGELGGAGREFLTIGHDMLTPQTRQTAPRGSPDN